MRSLAVIVVLLSASVVGQWTTAPSNSTTAPGNWTTYVSSAPPPPPPPPPAGVPWAGIVDAGRATDWRYVGVDGGIPPRTTICETVPPSGLTVWASNTAYATNAQIADSNGNTQTATVGGTSGPDITTNPFEPKWATTAGGTTTDNNITWTTTLGGSDTANIQAALGRCNGRSQIVQLTAGVYTMSPGLTFNGDTANSRQPISYVTLRGAGPDQTKLIFRRLSPLGVMDIAVQGNNGWQQGYTGTVYRGGAARWDGDSALGSYRRGDATLMVTGWMGNTAGPPQVGDILILDQRNDTIGVCPATGGTGTNCTGIAGATQSGTTATITTSLPHHFRVGQCVGVGDVGGNNSVTAYNARAAVGTCNSFTGWFTITAVPSPTTFQYETTPGLPDSGGDPSGPWGCASVDTGGVYNSDCGGASVGQHLNTLRRCPDKPNSWPIPNCDNAAGEISMRNQTELKKVTSVTPGGSTTPDGVACPANYTCYGIDPPLEMPNWRASQSPGVWWTGPGYDVYDGIEDLSMDTLNDRGTPNTGGIRFRSAYNCWVKNVRMMFLNRNAIWISYASKITIVDSYFFGTKGGGSQSYFVEGFIGNDNLIQNNICENGMVCLMVGSDIGSVYSYNYMSGVPSTTVGGMSPLINENHDTANLDLFEGNNSPGLNVDNTHGHSVLQTMFRSRLRGQDTPLKINSVGPASIRGFNRGYNYVGNVMGTAGLQNIYQNVDTIIRTFIIWAPGRYTIEGPVAPGWPQGFDPFVLSTMFRWGNYDVVTAANNAGDGTRWCDTGAESNCGGISEIPKTPAIADAPGNNLPANATPANHNLPTSFYLGGQPLFWVTPWGTPGWPPIGPDVVASGPLDATCTGDPTIDGVGSPTACDGVNHMSYQIPAQICFNHMPIDQSYQQSFPISNAVWSSSSQGNTVVTVAPMPVKLTVGDYIMVTGVTPNGYNGRFHIMGTVQIGGTSMQYRLPINPGANGSGGQVTIPNVRVFNARNCYPQDF